jgi:porin
MKRTHTWCAVLGCACASLPIVLSADEESASVARFDALYTSELWQNMHGGLRTGSKLLGDLDVAAEIDGERAFGLDGVTLFANGLFVHGGSLSGQYIGDAQTVSNIEAAHQARLFELWVEKRFGPADDGHSLRVGLYDLNSEFDVSDTGSLFVNSSHGISPQIAQTGLNGPSIFPVTSLGARWRWAIGPTWSAQFVALDGVPGDPNRPASNAIRFDAGDGLLLASEIARQGTRLKKIAVGAWRYTAHFDQLDANAAHAAATASRAAAPMPASASALAVSGAAALGATVVHAEAVEATSPPLRSGNHVVYALVDAQLFAERADPKQGLSAFARAGTADSRVNRFANFIGAGVVYTGALPQRPDDQLGLAVASANNSGSYRIANARDGIATNRRETAIELTYRFALTSWLTLQGDLQHIINPDTNPLISDATAIGLRFEFTATKRL